MSPPTFLDPSEKTDLPPVRFTGYVMLISFISALASFLFGVDTANIAGAILFIEAEFHLTQVQIEFIVGATTLGAIFGGFGAGYLSDRVGRKWVTLSSSVIFIAGALVIALANSYEVLLLGRLVVGIAVGLASMIVPAYLAEISPKELRGQLVTVNVLLITGGQLAAYIVSVCLASVPNGWRIMMGLAAIPAAIQLIGMPLLPESPRYLFAKGDRDGARKILQRIYGVRNDPDGSRVEAELDSIDCALKETQGASYRDLFKRENRIPLIIACGLQALQQFTGFNTAMYYSAAILKMAGFKEAKDAVAFSLLVAATNFIVTIVALKIIDRVGRRKILLYTVALMTCGLVLLGVAFALLSGLTSYQTDCSGYGSHCGACNSDDRCIFTSSATCVAKNAFPSVNLAAQVAVTCPGSKEYGWFALASLVFYVASYALGLGNTPWLIQSEIFTAKLRGKAGGIATATNWTSNLIVSITFLSLTQAISAAGTFWLYAGVGVLGWLFVWKLVPETKGKSLEEIRMLFVSKDEQ